MSIRAIETIQSRLRDLGDYAGVVDNEEGPLTSRAVVDFKARHGFAARDYLGPLTASLLFSDEAKPRPARPTDRRDPPWLVEIVSKLGMHEVEDNAALRAWLRSDGSTLGDPARLPWCGDAVETAIKLTLPAERIPANPYLARNWLGFGRECGIVRGAICVFWRGSRHGMSGHVGFVAGEDAGTVHVYGGNQSDAITLTRLDKARLLGCRWPLTFPMTGDRVLMDALGAISVNEA